MASRGSMIDVKVVANPKWFKAIAKRSCWPAPPSIVRLIADLLTRMIQQRGTGRRRSRRHHAADLAADLSRSDHAGDMTEAERQYQIQLPANCRPSPPQRSPAPQSSDCGRSRSLMVLTMREESTPESSFFNFECAGPSLFFCRPSIITPSDRPRLVSTAQRAGVAVAIHPCR